MKVGLPARLALAALLSLSMHGIVYSVLAGVKVPNLSPSEVELQVVVGETRGETPSPSGMASRRAAPLVRLVPPGATPTREHLSGRGEARGGDGRGPVSVVFLASEADAVTLQDSLANNLDHAQISRVRVARTQVTRERRRATPNPHDQPFLATGTGRVRERRPDRARAPSQGAPHPERQPRLSGAWASPDEGEVIPSGEPEPSRLGRETRSVQQGVSQGTRAAPSPAAPIATGRQPVDEGRVATPSPREANRPRDNQLAEHLAMRLSRSWVDATRRRGEVPSIGAGGQSGGGEPALGQRGGGTATARAYTPGPGRNRALDTRDHRYLSWYLAQRRRVERGLRYPRERARRMDQGTAVFRLRVRRDGSIQQGPNLIRSSGFADLDRAAERALAAAMPFDPLPAELAPHQHDLPLTLSLEFANPLVR